MQRYEYQSLESKKWSMTAVLGVTALVAVSLGATIGFVAGNGASTALYAPTTVQSTVGTVAVPVTRRATQAQAERTVVEPISQTAEQVIYGESTQTFNWAPVAALIAVPTAIAAFLLRKAQEAPMKVAAVSLAAGALMASAPMPADAAESVSGLTPCAESKAFNKNLKKEVKNLEKRQKLYEPGSAPYLALESTKTRTEARFAKYAKQGLLCGTDGLPHLISDPGLAVRYGHAGETLIPTVGFLYIAGYIGTAGRTYLQEVATRQKPTQSEIIIDVPLATSIAFRSWNWPGKAVEELFSGKLLEKDENIPVSRR